MKKLLFIILLPALISACIKPYQPDLQQGNIINNRDLSELTVGMSKQEVLYILGTPLVTDPFNQSRWEYFYSKVDRQENETVTRLITLIFDGNALVDMTGDAQLATVKQLQPSLEDQQFGGTVITEPTQKRKGALSRLFD
jgi:outer membrane protein assembly factor BamE